jgi:hypothetical protein
MYQATLQWDRADTLYSGKSMVQHDTHSNPLAKKIDAEWAV